MTTYRAAIEKIVGRPVKVLRNRSCFRILANQVGDPSDGQEIARFSMCVFPACCGACLSFGSSVSLPYRNKGLGKLLNRMRIQIAHNSRRTLMLCADVSRNTHQMRLLEANGWKKGAEFTNSRSGNLVSMHYRLSENTGMAIGMTDQNGNELAVPEEA